MIQRPTPDDLPSLEEEKEQLSRRLRNTYDLLGDVIDEKLLQRIENDRKRIKEIDRELTELNEDDVRSFDKESFVESVLRRLQTLPQEWRIMPYAQIKNLLQVVVENLRIDQETGRLTFGIIISLDLDALGISDEEKPVRLDSPLPWQSPAKANQKIGICIAEIVCEQALNGKDDCYHCRRKRKAA